MVFLPLYMLLSINLSLILYFFFNFGGGSTVLIVIYTFLGNFFTSFNCSLLGFQILCSLDCLFSAFSYCNGILSYLLKKS